MKFLRDTWLIFTRQMLLVWRTPARLVIGFVQPIAYLVLFAPLLKTALAPTGAQTYADAYRVYVPGLLVVLVLLSGFFAGFQLLGELRSGVIERSRVTPVSRTALILGRAFSEVVTLMGQAVVITVVALPFGLTVHLGWLMLAYLMLALMALMACALSYAMAMLIPSPAALGPLINSISQPLSLLSGVLLPLSLAPGWLVAIAEWNPIYWTTNGTRSLFTGNPGDVSVWAGMLIVIALAALTVTWATRMFARQVR
ncbi:ABC transporter permease [Actinokineospora globicatena]|uniref:Transport permease protein n=1 Tax=Actinokineospora globicatena TaxID=103729 RepID=A0A9W6QH97_9PSEU|nr:ABC transporter permease [Actinokineospora globicatena]MCP2306545.1 ABC-2 type transport system permease protein [Actinokineospora globicatena]GLW81976.1 transport permease protein [Actinokineospora globicatena]GLW88770.1 transport permease protein [Actinokineospora globicatena]GLW89352.1 transport permease protein [Actinokineospora globicatena]